MTVKGYRPRVVDLALAEEMQAFGAVVLVGPKMCGKTTTAERISNSEIKLQKKTEYEKYRAIADLDPSIILKSKYPLLIDEWQMIPELWDEIRAFVDEQQEKGMFILTGSNNIDEEKISHSGTGRISRIKMYTMSLYESGDSTGTVSLGDLFKGKDLPADVSNHTLEDVISVLVRGGWPSSIGMSPRIARKAVEGYCRSILESDINEGETKRRDPQRMSAILRSLSRNESTEASYESILRDVSSNDAQMNINTLYDYISVLRKICIVDDLPAWSPKLRSKTAVRTSDVRHLSDPSIAAYFLDADGDDLLKDPKTLGFLFESLAIRDLRIYAQALGGNLYHYRDSKGLEADAIIHTPGGKWAAFEVKLSDKHIDDGANNLIKLKGKVEIEPEFLAVIIPTGTFYRRDDGVYVIPITLLGP